MKEEAMGKKDAEGEFGRDLGRVWGEEKWMQAAATEKKATEQLEEAGKAYEERVGHRRCPEGRVWGQLKAEGGTLRSQERGWEWEGAGRPDCKERQWGRRTGKEQNVRALRQQERPGGRGRDLRRRGNPGATRGAHVGGDVETPGPAPFRWAALQLPQALYKFHGSGRSTRGRYPGGRTAAAAASAPATTAS